MYLTDNPNLTVEVCEARDPDKIFARNAEVSLLRKKLNDNGLTWTRSGVDFPATTKVEKPENKIFKEVFEHVRYGKEGS